MAERPYCTSTGKIAYEDKRTARAAAQGLTKRRGKQTRFYRCNSCGGWHITSRPFVKAHSAAFARAGGK